MADENTIPRPVAAAMTEIEIAINECGERGLSRYVIANALMIKTVAIHDEVLTPDGRRVLFKQYSKKPEPTEGKTVIGQVKGGVVSALKEGITPLHAAAAIPWFYLPSMQWAEPSFSTPIWANWAVASIVMWAGFKGVSVLARRFL